MRAPRRGWMGSAVCDLVLALRPQDGIYVDVDRRGGKSAYPP